MVTIRDCREFINRSKGNSLVRIELYVLKLDNKIACNFTPALNLYLLLSSTDTSITVCVCEFRIIMYITIDILWIELLLWLNCSNSLFTGVFYICSMCVRVFVYVYIHVHAMYIYTQYSHFLAVLMFPSNFLTLLIVSSYLCSSRRSNTSDSHRALYWKNLWKQIRPNMLCCFLYCMDGQTHHEEHVSLQ